MHQQILLSTLLLGAFTIKSIAIDADDSNCSPAQTLSMKPKLERKRAELDLGMMVQTGICPTPLNQDEIATLFSAPFVSKPDARETMGPVTIRGMRAAIKEPRETVEKFQALLKSITKADDINSLLKEEVNRPVATTQAKLKALGTYVLRFGSIEKYKFKVAFSSIDSQKTDSQK